jgi:hypothetical protein
MKRIIVACILALSLLSLGAMGFIHMASTARAAPPAPSVQMLSAQYSNATINAGTKVTLETLTFTVSSTAKLEVTSDNAITGNIAYSCDIALDGSTLISQSLLSFNGSFPSDIVDLTVTDTSVAAGSHTLTVDCTNQGANGAGSNDGSVSAIVTTGL